MEFGRWFKGYGANNELQAEVDKLRKESIDYVHRYEQLEKVIAEHRTKKNELLSNIDYLYKKLEERDVKVASFAEEIARLKKLIAAQQSSANNISIPPQAPAFGHTVSATEGPVTPEQKNAIEQMAKVWRDKPELVTNVVRKSKSEGVKGKGNERTTKPCA